MNNLFKIEAGNPEQTMGLLEAKIYDYNEEAIGEFDGDYFSFTVKNDDGVVIAGVAGWAWAKACEITQLWVDAAARKKGIGKQLLASAEAVAKRAGCRTILVKTYSFQAPQFYGKHGYKTRHVERNFPPGHDYFILSKWITR